MDTQQPTPTPVKKKPTLTVTSWSLFGVSIVAIFVAPIILLLFVTLIATMFGANIGNEMQNVSYGGMLKGSLSSIGLIPFVGAIVGLIAATRTKTSSAWGAFAANTAMWLICVVAFFATL